MVIIYVGIPTGKQEKYDGTYMYKSKLDLGCMSPNLREIQEVLHIFYACMVKVYGVSMKTKMSMFA